MANTKISALPTWTGTAADLRWFVMNNSGETITFKFSGYTSQVIPGNGVESYVTINVPRTHAPDDYMLVFGNHSGATASSGANSAVLGGRNNKTTNQFGIVAGGLNNSAGYICGVFGGNGGTADGNTAMIIGGENNTCSNVAWGGIVNGIQNYMGGGNDVGNGIIGGYLNRLQVNGVTGSHIIGGQQNRWHLFDSRNADTRKCFGAMIGGYSNRIEGLTTDTNGAHAYPLLMGGTLNKIFGEESNDSGTTGATIINSFTSTITKSSYSSIFGSNTSTISQATNSAIIGGSGHTIANSVNSAIIGGTGSTNSNKINTIMLGTSGRTAIDNHTTYVENLKVFNQIQEQFYDNGTIDSGVGGYIIDWSKGSKQTITITGGTNYLYYLDNVITGRCVLKVINTGTGGINWVDNAPKTWKLPASSPTNQPTHNATDIFVWESFDDQNLWLTTHSENLT